MEFSGHISLEGVLSYKWTSDTQWEDIFNSLGPALINYTHAQDRLSPRVPRVYCACDLSLSLGDF